MASKEPLNSQPQPTAEGARPGQGRRAARPTPAPVRRGLAEVGRTVATWRKLRGLTQQQLADRAGISTSTLVRLERGVGNITTEHLLRVLRALGILDVLTNALDPYQSDIGRLRADEQIPQRVRPKRLAAER